MNKSRLMAQAPVLLAVLIAVSVTSARAALPQAEYSCQVRTLSGATGLVELQVDTLEKARWIALQVEALTVTLAWEKVAEVTQCIRRPDGRFIDPVFQAFYESVPR